MFVFSGTQPVASPHHVWPGGQQCPFEQISPTQVVPHMPQLAGSVFVFAQPEAQHACPGAHDTSQLPQVLVLVLLTHEPPQHCSDAEQSFVQLPHASSGGVHAPPQQSSPAAHALPHVPQLASSV